MNMNDNIRLMMRDATRLVNSGQLMDATRAIQQALGGQALANTTPPADGAKSRSPIEGIFRVLDRAESAATTADDPTLHTAPLFVHARTPFNGGWQGFKMPASCPGTAPGRTAEIAPGAQFIAGSFSNAAGTRSYKLYVPSGYHGQALPVVVMLHGCTQNPDDFAAGTRMNELAEEQSCFVLYPAQAKGANIQNCWNWFKNTDQQRDSGESSLIAGMTREIIATHKVDERRVYVAGFSAGGAMAAVMGVTYPDLYAAVGVHSGLAYGAAHDLPSAFAAMQGNGAAPARPLSGVATGFGQRAVPIIVFHGDRDTTVNARNADQIIVQGTSGYHAAAGEKPRVTVHPGQIPGGHAYTRTIYRDAAGQPFQEQWQIHGASHAWSGGSVTGSYTDPKGPDAAKEVLRFFTAHPLPEAASRH